MTLVQSGSPSDEVASYAHRPARGYNADGLAASACPVNYLRMDHILRIHQRVVERTERTARKGPGGGS